MQLKNVSIKKICFADDLFRLHHLSPQQIKWNGEFPLFNPIWVHETDDGYRLIDGFSIVEKTMESNGVTSIPAYVYPKETDCFLLLKMRLAKRLTEHNLSVFDLGEVVARFQSLNFLSQAQTLAIYETCEMVNPRKATQVFSVLIPNKRVLESFTEVYHLKYKELEMLAKFDSEELDAIGQLLLKLNLSGNKLMKILKLIEELKLGFDLSPSDLIRHPLRSKVGVEMAPHHRYAAISHFLTEVRNPRRSKLLAAWIKNKRKLPLPNMEIIDDSTFEADHIKLLLTFSTQEMFENQVKTLSKMVKNEDFLDLFAFL